MSSISSNNEEYTENIDEWHKMAQYKLKTKITNNIKKRAINTAQAINHGLKHLIQNTQSNHIWSALFPNQSIKKYSDIFPLFITPQQTIDDALDEILKKVDEWPGVDINATNEIPTDFKKYWTISDNWWNRYKAEWIGDYFFYPLLQNALYRYIIRLTDQYTTSQYNKAETSQQRVEYEQNATNELLYFIALRKILYAKVTFNRARAQPLILDQAFIKSECLQQFFAYLGNQHNVEWIIPPNDKKNKNRLHIRHYAREWVEKILTQKAELYDSQVMRMDVSVDIDDKNDANIDDNIYIIDNNKCNNHNIIEPQKPPQPIPIQSSYDNINFLDNIPPPIIHQQSTTTSSTAITPALSGLLPFNTNNGNNSVNNGTNTGSLYFHHRTGRIMPQNNNVSISNMDNTVINGMNNNISISDNQLNQTGYIMPQTNNVSISNMNNNNNNNGMSQNGYIHPSASYQSAATNSVFSQQPQQYYNTATQQQQQRYNNTMQQQQQQPMMHIFEQQNINNHDLNVRKSPDDDTQTIHSNNSHNSRQSGSTHNSVSTIAASISNNNASQSTYCTVPTQQRSHPIYTPKPYRPFRRIPTNSHQYVTRSHPFYVPSRLLYTPRIASNRNYIQQQQPQNIASNINNNASSFHSIPTKTIKANVPKMDIAQTVNNEYSQSHSYCYNAGSTYSPSINNNNNNNHEISQYNLPETSMEDPQTTSFENESIFDHHAIFDEEEININFPSIDNISNGLDFFN